MPAKEMPKYGGSCAGGGKKTLFIVAGAGVKELHILKGQCHEIFLSKSFYCMVPFDFT